MDIRGFLRWQFAGTLSTPSFYGFVLGILGLILSASGVPHAGWIFILGMVIVFVDAVRWYFRFSYSIYNMERRQIERELARKE